MSWRETGPGRAVWSCPCGWKLVVKLPPPPEVKAKKPDKPTEGRTTRPVNHTVTVNGFGRAVSVQEIIGRVCDALRLSLDQLCGNGRMPVTVLAREIITVLARQHTNRSFPDIAEALGRPNHSSVVSMIKRFEEEKKRERALRSFGPMPEAVHGLTVADFMDRITREVSR